MGETEVLVIDSRHRLSVLGVVLTRVAVRPDSPNANVAESRNLNESYQCVGYEESLRSLVTR